MDCADDAREIEQAAKLVAGVRQVKVSSATHVMTLDASAESVANVQQDVERLGYRLETESSSEVQAPIVSRSYRRALWIVVALNVGFGLIEIVGGFIAGSQALKADALDFIGDGLITMLAVIALGRSMLWRARSALIQGIFLGALGLGVLGSTLFRLINQQRPEVDVMGILGLIALGVNVAAAAVLVPHRSGDANARAVWLFSRNDAIGNAAVVVAAIFVAWTETSWPDLLVAALISVLFMHSALAIIRDARWDLRLARRT